MLAAKQPVISTSAMHPPLKNFVLISKAYSDGISLQKQGPQITREFKSECVLEGGKSFRTAASLVPKLVAKHFVTTLTVADEMTYYECIVFERRSVMKNFSETTNVFLPKEKTNKYCSSLLFDPDGIKRSYLAGIELLPAKKCVALEDLNYKGESDAICCVEKCALNGDPVSCQQLMNGRI